MLLLALETTCDETAAAIIDSELRVVSQVVASQERLHQRFAGVVPEIAARAHVERLLPVLDETLRRGGVALADLSLIAVANTPGLAGSLLVGLVAAKAIAWAFGKPLVAVNHLHAHIFACRLAYGPQVFPCVGLVVSGGHTSLFRCRDPLEFAYLGGTIDDAAGEAFDKVAAMLGLPYPGGPSIAAAAETGDPRAFRFPRSFIHEPDRLDFSFSGLKTAVRYEIFGTGKPAEPRVALTLQRVADLAASFQEAVVDCLVAKTMQAARHTRTTNICAGGGVAANRRFRTRLAEEAAKSGCKLFLAPPELCTDNAVMGAIAFEKFRRGEIADLNLDIHAGLVRGPALS